jgi:CubicO group peptidase (beta-lactamase class C family)
LADLEHNVPNTTETIFECGSVSKQFTATAILVLAREGKLSLEDDVRKYIPELPVYDAPITIQHLLNHTSGLKDWGSVGALTGWPRTTRAYTNALAIHIITLQKRTNFTPGTQYSYSNSNYTLLTEIVERVSKKTLARFTDSVFFKPLGMTSTKWRDNFREILRGRAVAYSTSSDKYQQMMPFENVHGHGGLLTTTQDLLKWNLLLANPVFLGERVDRWRKKQGVLKNGKRLGYASGININDFNGQTEISHSGATAGYRGWLAFYPKQKLSIIFLSNDSRFDIGKYAQGIAKLFLGGPEEKPQKEIKYVPLASNEQQKWSGFYRQKGDANYFSLNVENGKMISDGTEVKAIHSDTLRLNSWVKLTWKKNDLLTINGAGDTSTYKRVPPPDLSATNLKSLVGSYYSEEAETTFKILADGTAIYYWRDPNTKEKLKPVFKDAFVNEDYWLLEFLRDKKNQITGATISVDRAQRVPFKKMN